MNLFDSAPSTVNVAVGGKEESTDESMLAAFV